MKLPVQKIKLTLAISWAVLSCTQVQAQSVKPSFLTTDFRLWEVEPPQLRSQAEPGSQNIESSAQLIFAAPPPPPDIGEPGQRSEAGSRGCGQDMNKPLTSVAQKRLTALVPVYSGSELVFGATIAEHPSFWFYVPYSSSSAYGEFVLEDEAQNQTIYKTSLTGTPGVVSLRLPSKAAPLDIGKRYRWYFNIYCKNDNQIIADVEGYVKRKQLNSALKTQLQKATPRQRIALYTDNGIWYEALTTAAELRRTQPQDTSWATLLQAVDLNSIVTESTVECCTLENQQ